MHINSESVTTYKSLGNWILYPRPHSLLWVDNNSLVSVGHLCDLPAGFATSDNLVTLFYIKKNVVPELQLMST